MEKKSESRQKGPARSWARLDNAGKIYPSLVSSRNTTLFRLSVLLDKPVHVAILQDALDRIMPRFPYYQVHLQRGAFWYYFIPSEHRVKVERDSRYPCTKMPIRQRTRFPFRVRAFRNQIALECSHILTDGTGAALFFQAILAEYLKQRAGWSGSLEGLINRDDPIHPEESEDAFPRYFQKDLPQPARDGAAFKIRNDLTPKGIYQVTTGRVSVSELKQASKKLGLTMTGFLTALLIEVFQDALFGLPEKERKRRAAPIRICIPVNLRRFFPSRTMRNFFLSLYPGIDPRLGRHSFEEISQQVEHYLAMNLNKRVLGQQITRNIQGEKQPFVRLLPCWIKDRITPLLYRWLGESAYTTVLSNMGAISFPKEMMAHIKRYDFIPNPPESTTLVKVGIVSYGDEMSISFGRISRSSLVEREFFRKLRKLGIAVKIDSNTWRDEE